MDVDQATLAQDAPKEVLAVCGREIHQYDGPDASMAVMLVVDAERVEACGAKGTRELGTAAEDLQAVAVPPSTRDWVGDRGTLVCGLGR